MSEPRRGATTGRPASASTTPRVTERAALAAARWLGRDDQDGAEEAAATGMRLGLEAMPIEGRS